METYKDHITLTPDMNEERLNTLRELFPDWFTQEGHLDINEVKKAVNSDSVEETERYEFRWFGKSAAKRNAFTPTRATLHYDAERSVNADKTDNIIIEGENLEVLKILSSSYRGKVKCIYIDPPYNTGNENWVYNDNVNRPKIKKWLGHVVGKDSEDLTRHDKWLCMMYPRLKLLQKLLSNDGAIFISIDDNEQANLKLICDEMFGAGYHVTIVKVPVRSLQSDYRTFTHLGYEIWILAECLSHPSPAGIPRHIQVGSESPV